VSRGVWGRLRREDDGQLLLLVLAYAFIAAVLVTVVVDVSQAYLYRRSLLAAADAAALAAANQPDLARVYDGDAAGSGDVPLLPLSDAGTRQAVEQYASDAELAERFADFEVVDVATDGGRVTVTLRAVAHLPFVNMVASRWRDGYPVRAAATARSPLVP
jgi:Flp pilus assembly protein TadG